MTIRLDDLQQRGHYRELEDLIIIRLWDTDDFADLKTVDLPKKNLLVFYFKDNIAPDAVSTLHIYRPADSQLTTLPEFPSLHWKPVKPAIKYFDGQQLRFVTRRFFTDKELNRVICQLLQDYLIFGRPLGYYRCTFFFPILPDENGQARTVKANLKPYTYPTVKIDTHAPDSANPQTDNPQVNREAAEAQAYWYFLPAMRDLLYQCNRDSTSASSLKPLEEWRLPTHKINYWRLVLEHDGQTDTQGLITDVILYRYFNHIDLLAVSVESYQQHPLIMQKNEQTGNDEVSCCSLHADKDNWWQELVFCDHRRWKQLQSLQLEHWLRYTRFVRQLYPSFKEQYQEEKIAQIRLVRPGFDDVIAFDQHHPVEMRIPEHVGQNISAPIKTLLGYFYPCEQNSARLPFPDEYRDVYDDRMFVNVSYGLNGPQLDKNSLSRLYALALFVDRRTDAWINGYAFNPNTAQQFMKEQSLHLWDEIGTFFGCTDYSHVALGSGTFFNQKIAPIHMRFIYERMLIQALLYRASLHLYSRQVALGTEALLNQNRTSIRQLHKDFIRFTNQYWFHNVTTQTQGKQLFTLQQNQLGLHTQYQIIKEELERTDEYMETEYQAEIQSKSSIWTSLAGIIGFYALWFALLPYFDNKGLITASGSIKECLILAWETDPVSLSNCTNRWQLLWVFAPPLTILIPFSLYFLARKLQYILKL